MSNHLYHDHNLRAAYLHVLAGPLTSLLAIFALFSGKLFGWVWIDPLMGIVGAIIILLWSYGLLRDSGKMLLDAEVDQKIVMDIKARIEKAEDVKVSDIHVWEIGSHHLAGIISLVTSHPKPVAHYKKLVADWIPYKY